MGKTSILYYLLDNEVRGYVYVYVDTERVDEEQDFYKKILKEIFRVKVIAKSNRLHSVLKAGGQFLGKIKSIHLLGSEINFNEEEKDVDYYEELTNFLSGFELEDGKKLVLLLDEFPQTLLNIVEAQNGDTKQAVRFLQSNRELRLNPGINGKVQFVYTGSIGLNHTVASINASAFVNDLSSVEVEPLTRMEAEQLLHNLLREKKFTTDQPAVDHLLDRIGWFIPFHIQLAIQELMTLAHESRHINKEIVDKGFENIVDLRNNSHFEHYYSRLKSQFKGKAFHYADELLQKIATAGSLTRAELIDLSLAYDQGGTYRQVLNALVYDGYINNTGDPNTYRFNSPIVRLWWQQSICK